MEKKDSTYYKKKIHFCFEHYFLEDGGKFCFFILTEKRGFSKYPAFSRCPVGTDLTDNRVKYDRACTSGSRVTGKTLSVGRL